MDKGHEWAAWGQKGEVLFGELPVPTTGTAELCNAGTGEVLFRYATLLPSHGIVLVVTHHVVVPGTEFVPDHSVPARPQMSGETADGIAEYGISYLAEETPRMGAARFMPLSPPR